MNSRCSGGLGEERSSLMISRLSCDMIRALHEDLTKFSKFKNRTAFDTSPNVMVIEDVPNFMRSTATDYHKEGTCVITFTCDEVSTVHGDYVLTLYVCGDVEVVLSSESFMSHKDGKNMELSIEDSFMSIDDYTGDGLEFIYEPAYGYGDEYQITIPDGGLSEERYFQLSTIHDIPLDKDSLNALLQISKTLGHNQTIELYHGYSGDVFEHIDFEVLIPLIRNRLLSSMEHKK